MDKIIYPFPNFNYWAIEDCEWISNLYYIFLVCDDLIMIGLKSIHVSERGQW